MCRAYVSTWKLPVVVTHSSNNYGPYQYPEKVVPFFVTRLLEGKKVPVYGTGENVRDWLFVLDHCAALLLALLKGRPGEVYDIGGDTELSNLELARLILKHFNKDDSWIEFVADRPGHDLRYAIDSSRIRMELGWKPAHSFTKTFTQTIEWYKRHRDWTKRLKIRTESYNPHLSLP